MDQHQAEKVVGRMLAGYPGRDMPTTSIAVFVTDAMPFTYEEGLEAAKRVQKASPQRLPSEVQWEDALLAASHERRTFQQTLALPEKADGLTLQEWLATPEGRKTWGRMQEALSKGAEATRGVLAAPASDPAPLPEIELGTPCEDDFCPECGGVYTQTKKGRACGVCGRLERVAS